MNSALNEQNWHPGKLSMCCRPSEQSLGLLNAEKRQAPFARVGQPFFKETLQSDRASRTATWLSPEELQF